MASGAVTVAGNNAGYAEVMSGLGQVSIVNPQDPEEFARKLRLLLTEPALRKLWLSWAKSMLSNLPTRGLLICMSSLTKTRWPNTA